MAMCSIKLAKYERAFKDCQRALELQKGARIDPEIAIKLKYRLALCLSHFRDYQGATNVLKHLKKYCNLQERIDLFTQTTKLLEKISELENHRENCKFRGVTFATGPKVDLESSYTDTCANIMGKVSDYVSPKLEIGEIEGKGRCVTAIEKINRGECLMVA